jgi:hypothetical protein
MARCRAQALAALARDGPFDPANALAEPTRGLFGFGVGS